MASVVLSEVLVVLISNAVEISFNVPLESVLSELLAQTRESNLLRVVIFTFALATLVASATVFVPTK